MDDKTQKERLEQELRFLKESFEADVISKEEFEKGRDRIERKLKELQSIDTNKISEEKKSEVSSEQEMPKEAGDEEKEEEYILIEDKDVKPSDEKISEETKIEEQKRDDAMLSAEPEKIKLSVIQDEDEEQEHEHEDVTIPEQKTIAPNSVPETSITKDIKKKKSNFFRYSIIFVVLALVVFFSYSLLQNKKNTQEKANIVKFVAACNSNDDCKQEGKEGLCLHAGTQDAKCELKEIERTNVIIVNDRNNCFNCDTQRVLNILEGWFGTMSAKEIDYNTEEGRKLADMNNAKLLPMYVLDESIMKQAKFEQIKQIFIKKGNNYVLSEGASGSTFYVNRDNIPMKLDIFVISGDDASIKSEKNLKEFLDAFKEVKFDKHLPNDKPTQELGIKNFPTFLVNNRVKFSGVQSAETIKENFCYLNKITGCEKNLSKSLV